MNQSKEIEQMAAEYSNVFQYLSSKKRGRREPMRIAKVAKESRTPRERALGLFKKLEAMGLGQVIHGSSGQAIKFAWKVNPISVGRAATERGSIVSFKNRIKPLPRLPTTTMGQDLIADMRVVIQDVVITGPKSAVMRILDKL